MKRSMLAILLLSVFSFSAHADYFFCELSQMGTTLAFEEAEYRVLKASVAAEGFQCEGFISGNQTKVRLTDISGDRVAEASERNSSASTSLSTLPRHNEYDMICTCGMK